VDRPEIMDRERLLELVVGGCPSVLVHEVGLKYEALKLCNPWLGLVLCPIIATFAQRSPIQ
jgi:hypothetical protein